MRRPHREAFRLARGLLGTRSESCPHVSPIRPIEVAPGVANQPRAGYPAPESQLMPQALLLPSARSDLAELWDYINYGNHANADKLVDRIRSSCSTTLAENRRVGRSREELAQSCGVSPSWTTSFSTASSMTTLKLSVCCTEAFTYPPEAPMLALQVPPRTLRTIAKSGGGKICQWDP